MPVHANELWPTLPLQAKMPLSYSPSGKYPIILGKISFRESLSLTPQVRMTLPALL